jgi:hypothetical protein
MNTAEQAFEEVLRLRVAVSSSEVSVHPTTATATTSSSSMETARRLRELTLLFERQHLIDRVGRLSYQITSIPCLIG